jgi:hypothetical protein
VATQKLAKLSTAAGAYKQGRTRPHSPNRHAREARLSRARRGAAHAADAPPPVGIWKQQGSHTLSVRTCILHAVIKEAAELEPGGATGGGGSSSSSSNPISNKLMSVVIAVAVMMMPKRR